MMHNEQKVTDSIYWIGANDFVTPRFDNLVPLPQGISYNTYFIDDEKTCVLDGIDNTCRDIFMDNLSYLLKGRALDYIIINHMEPDCLSPGGSLHSPKGSAWGALSLPAA